MDYSVQNISNYYLYDTRVDNLFISEYMTSAPGDFVKAYMLANMYAQISMPFDARSLCKALGMSAERLSECWDYWEGRGVISKSLRDPSSPEDYTVEFTNLREEAFGRRAPVQQTQQAVRLDDRALAKLYRDIEAETGRMLESREPEEVASWLSEYGMSPEFILFGYKFCTAKRKSNKCRYVSAVLKDWKSKNLSSPAQVEKYLETVDMHYDLYRKVFRELGFSRSPSEEEKRIMNKWADDYGFGLDKIFEACKKTAGITNPNINYVDAVLSAWKKEEGKPQAADPELLTARVEDLYRQDREANALKSAQMREEIFTKIPRTKSIMEELRSSSFTVSKYMLMGDAGRESAARERERMKRLREERTALLARAGYGPDALDAIYTCSKCKDTGLTDSGQRCSCYKDKLRLLAGQEGKG